jgi:hypothetical protein
MGQEDVYLKLSESIKLKVQIGEVKAIFNDCEIPEGLDGPRSIFSQIQVLWL